MSDGLKAIITVGIPASGKSTWGRDFAVSNPEWVVLEIDDLCKELYLKHYKPPFSWAKWEQVSSRFRIRTRSAMKRRILEIRNNGYNIVVIGNYTNKTKHDKTKQYLESIGYFVETKFFYIDLETAIYRNSIRVYNSQVTEKTIRNKYKSLMETWKIDEIDRRI